MNILFYEYKIVVQKEEKEREGLCVTKEISLGKIKLPTYLLSWPKTILNKDEKYGFSL